MNRDEIEDDMTRDDVREWLVELLLDRVRESRCPSYTQLDLLERWIPRRRIPEYLRVLQEKVEQDRYPSIPLLRRIRRVAERLPHHHERERDEVPAG
jgi:hypothetical protein